MRAFLNGKEGDVLDVAKDADLTINCQLMEDDGGQHDLSTATLALVVYSRADRNVAPSATHAGTVDVAADGKAHFTIADTAMNYGPGTYYAFVVRTLSGAIVVARKPTIIRVG
jgi:hypothetical protein